jgi:hypothetical protein
MSTYGNTAPSQNTVNYDSLLSTTLFNYRKTLADNIFKSSGFLTLLRQKGGVEYQSGGIAIAQPLMYETNSSVKSYSKYDTLDTTPQDGFTTAFYNWCEVAGTIAIARLEERQNSGEAAILKLLEKKTVQAEMSIKQSINTMLIQGTVSSSSTFVPGNDAKDLYPLGYFLRKLKATDPVTGGNVGNIAGATYSWWRHRVADLGGNSTTNADVNVSVTTRAALKMYLYRLWNFCSRGGDGSGPDIILADQVTYETYEMALDASKQFYDVNLADLGFDNIRLKGGVCVWDELVPDVYTGTAALTCGSAFMINSKFYKLVIDSETDFITTPFIEPENQTAKVAKILFMGNATVSNLRKHGVAIAISQSIAS